MVHIGKKIKEVLEARGLSVKSFSQEINKSRTVVYNIFERETIDTGLLKSISKVLKYDFFSYYTEAEKLKVKDFQAPYLKGDAAIVELQKEIDSIKKQIQNLNQLLVEKTDKKYSEKKKKS